MVKTYETTLNTSGKVAMIVAPVPVPIIKSPIIDSHKVLHIHMHACRDIHLISVARKAAA